MTNKKEDFHKVFQRFRFSRGFKRQALIQYSKLKKPKEALIACGMTLDEIIANDKKYAAKLLHKWRMELYYDSSLLSFMNCDLSDENLAKEIETLNIEN